MEFPFLTEDQRDEIYRDISRDTIITALEMKTDLLFKYIRKRLDNIGDQKVLEELNKESFKILNFQDMEMFIKLLEEFVVEEDKFIKVEIRDDYKEIYEIDEKQRWNEEIDISLALAALIQGKLRFAEASHLANKEIYEFIFILSRCGLDWKEYMEGSMEDEEEALLEIKKKKDLV